MPDLMKESTDICFAGWVLRRNSGELVRDGVCIRLQERPLQILEQLLLHPGELVTREQLIATLWPTGVVDFDTGLNTAVRKLRIALNDDAETPHYIETIPRRGYRFIGQIESKPSESGVYLMPGDAAKIASSSPQLVPPAIKQITARVRWIAWSIVALMLIAGMTGDLLYKNHVAKQQDIAATIVVLPFVDMSAEQQDQPFCDGLSEELSNWLAQVPALRVVSRSSAFSYKGKNVDARQVGKELNATHVLEGSIRRNGKEVRVTTQLINAKDGLHIWSKSFDMSATNVLQVEDRVSRAVTNALQVQLSARTSQQLASRQTTKIDAYELYLLARHYQRKLTADDNRRAIEFYKQAIDADKQFALAYIGLARATILQSYFGAATPRQSIKDAESLVDQATSLNPSLPETFSTKGLLFSEQYRFVEALSELKKALAINPNDAASNVLLGRVSQRLSQPRSALTYYSRAAELDPLDFMNHVNRCFVLQEMSRYDEATRACEQGRSLGPHSPWGAIASAQLSRMQGKLDDAVKWNSEAARIAPDDANVVKQRSQLRVLLQLPAATPKSDQSTSADTDLTYFFEDAESHFAQSGAKGLKAFLATVPPIRFDDFSDMSRLAALYYDIGDVQTARTVLQRARSDSAYSLIRLLDPSDVSLGYSPALTWAAVSLATNDEATGTELLEALETNLKELDRNGFSGHGLEYLRAEVAALRHHNAEAIYYLKRAVNKGWRQSWHAKSSFYFAGLRDHSEFRALLTEVDARNSKMAARVVRDE
jgi:TolB-like protein/DNA-binding winged helix-turn-helix (wHTH) protein